MSISNQIRRYTTQFGLPVKNRQSDKYEKFVRMIAKERCVPSIFHPDDFPGGCENIMPNLDEKKYCYPCQARLLIKNDEKAAR